MSEGAGGVNSVRIMPLKNAEATRIEGMLQSIYSGPNAAMSCLIRSILA